MQGIGLTQTGSQALAPPRLPGPPASAERRRSVMILAGSVLLHGVILGALALGAAGVDLRPTDVTDDPLPARPIWLRLEPRPLLPGETARVRPPVALLRMVPILPLTGSATADRRNPLRNTLTLPESPPAPPVPRAAAIPPATASLAPTAANPWAVATESTRAAVARSLRTGVAGCRTMAGQLGPAEQALCDDRFGTAAARAGPAGPRTLNASEQRREDQFAIEAAANLARYERRVAPLTGAIGVVGISPDCVGGNLRGTCAGANLPSRYGHSEENPYGGRTGPR
ncbi:hypothetical protein BH10PSE2_BH10PSE2_30780 [soil metagenome]